MYDDFLARILEPDVFLPSQFYGNSGLARQLDGEKRLMIAIMKDAVECLEKYRGSRTSAGKLSYQSAIQWVEDTDTDWLYSFTNICDLLGFDSHYLREQLLKRENRYSKPLRSRTVTLTAMSASASLSV